MGQLIVRVINLFSMLLLMSNSGCDGVSAKVDICSEEYENFSNSSNWVKNKIAKFNNEYRNNLELKDKCILVEKFTLDGNKYLDFTIADEEGFCHSGTKIVTFNCIEEKVSTTRDCQLPVTDIATEIYYNSINRKKVLPVI